MNNVYNAIIIDQNYCPFANCPKKDYGAVGDGQTDNTKVVEDSMDKELLHGLITNAKRHRIVNPYPWYGSLVFLALTIFVTNATIENISSVDSKFFHIHIFESRNIIFDSIKISAPGDSPNTDGIHIANSANIQVGNSVIGTGDDCISIGPGCTNLTIFSVLCGPGHGISVGSLGKNADEKDVIGLNVSKCNLTGTTNGLRIKTLQSSPSRLKATGFLFEHIIMNNVYNPIIIDQNYCPSANCPKKVYLIAPTTAKYIIIDPSLVKITDIKYRHITGTFLSSVAQNLVCSEAAPCEGVELSDISLKYNGNEKQAENASTCVHVHGSSNGNVKPDPCI
ncbi:Glycosyl hydrolases family 28 [Musa troglodytarum]|uniref:Glycosyl hydrolases family 28 n=1 Tax=Musa troglodytarum TaxID=320322 RepID=A0A9E7EDT2_9LILI|nr:Glycosyl hydrolases family 28 [Musa troglodytarum]